MKRFILLLLFVTFIGCVTTEPIKVWKGMSKEELSVKFSERGKKIYKGKCKGKEAEIMRYDIDEYYYHWFLFLDDRLSDWNTQYISELFNPFWDC